MALRTACLVLSAVVLAPAAFVPSKRDDLTACLAGAGVPFAAKGTAEWTDKIEPYNLRLAYTPAAVAIPSCTSQVEAAVVCGVKNGVRISAKGGGHSYASFGYGGEDGHLVIVLDQLYGVTLRKDGHAKVQPGARLGHVAVELYDQGQRAIAHGSCPGVGLAGHVLHGGYGFASRTHGLTLDWLVGATVVLANATTVHCSADENVDLFWALRGAGSSFGIVTEFEFDTFEAPRQATPFRIELSWNEDEAVDGLKAFQAIARKAPDELNMQIYMAPGGQSIRGMYYGTRSDLDAVLQPLVGDIGVAISSAGTLNWIEGLEHYANGQPLDQTEPYDAHSAFYTTSLMTKALTDDQIESFVRAQFKNANDNNARHSWYILMDVIGGEFSAVEAVPPSDTAYIHREKLFLYQLSDSVSSGAFPAAGISLLKGLRESITDLMDEGEWGMYANYVDSELDNETAQELYYGSNLKRLQSIKKAVDPEDVFWNPQGIRPA